MYPEKFQSTQLSHFKCKFKTEYFFEILVTYLVYNSYVNILKYLFKQKKITKRDPQNPYFSFDNNKKIYEFFVVLQSGFYKSH